jgi:hypothetical protein
MRNTNEQKGSQAAYRSVHLIGKVKIIAEHIKEHERQKESAEICVGNLTE